MLAIIKKELFDYVTSIRGLIMFLMVLGISLIALQAAKDGISGIAAESEYIFLQLFTTSAQTLPQVMNFHTLVGLFLIPVIGIALGFDAVNSERTSGTLSRILSQPIYRDEVINAKVLVRVFILAIMMLAAILLIAGFGLSIIGVGPISAEITRLIVYFMLTIVYGAFWLGLTVLFSVWFRAVGTSLLVALALWLVFSLFPIVASFNESAASTLQNIAFLSPSQLFLDASTHILRPLVSALGVIDPATSYQTLYMVFSPPSLNQSLLLAAPSSIWLVAWTALALAASYVLFMKQEVRYG